MSAEIIDFVAFRTARARTRLDAAFARPLPVDPSFLFWTGASGGRYVHTIYALLECPPFETANYVLVKRHDTGQRTVVAIGRAQHEQASLNLAEIRQRGADLGANEVHIHLLAGSISDGQRIEADLRGALVIA